MRATAVLYVGDLERMVTFYQESLGLSLIDEGDGYRGLEMATGLLTLVRTADARPSTLPARRRSQTPVKLAFEVSSIEGVRALIAERGGAVDPTGAEWVFRGRTHCDCVDPEGNIIQLIEAL